MPKTQRQPKQQGKVEFEELMTQKRLKLKARLVPMGDKFVVVIPKIYHEDITKRKWESKALYVTLDEEENGI